MEPTSPTVLPPLSGHPDPSSRPRSAFDLFITLRRRRRVLTPPLLINGCCLRNQCNGVCRGRRMMHSSCRDRSRRLFALRCRRLHSVVMLLKAQPCVPWIQYCQKTAWPIAQVIFIFWFLSSCGTILLILPRRSPCLNLVISFREYAFMYVNNFRPALMNWYSSFCSLTHLHLSLYFLQ